MDIAASPETVSQEDLDSVRRRIDSKELLFKVRVVSSEVRERQRSIGRAGAGQRFEPVTKKQKISTDNCPERDRGPDLGSAGREPLPEEHQS